MDFSGLVEFLTSATAPWWSGLLGIVIGAAGSYLTTKKSDERKFAEQRRQWDEERKFQMRQAMQASNSERIRARRAEARDAISNLIAASAQCEQAAWGFYETVAEHTREKVVEASSNLDYCMSQLQLIIDNAEIISEAVKLRGAALAAMVAKGEQFSPSLEAVSSARRSLIEASRPHVM